MYASLFGRSEHFRQFLRMSSSFFHQFFCSVTAVSHYDAFWVLQPSAALQYDAGCTATTADDIPADHGCDPVTEHDSHSHEEEEGEGSHVGEGEGEEGSTDTAAILNSSSAFLFIALSALLLAIFH